MKTPASFLVVSYQAFLLLTGVVIAQDQPKTIEPEQVSEFFALSPTGDLKPLERQKPRGLMLKGKRSPVRFAQGEPPAFVVRLASDVDPATIVQFVQLNDHNKNRVLEEIIGGSKKDVRFANLVPFEATKYGQGSFRIKPKTALSPGEYGLSLSTVKEGYFFGIDAPAESPK